MSWLALRKSCVLKRFYILESCFKWFVRFYRFYNFLALKLGNLESRF
ncbi:hypothetical protein DCO58_05635 [Helicobacter saguini]|uniref:Uncharacterized protein n=1 Tax=Helicobacter saguini TaxID=1548018 RepID=A0A6B0HNZ5_9HELI|nr:hypothetical protein [Helicobacter saguini]MWV62171.1 hypothetical protein [Helicobacter saguini]MWV67156.1 hypothetical protein [Helicobacter saguini]MWV69508.1 hypothetical protein [Helicobacter saguini]MWV70941.1 hypothetical protein [Helicobacter saguini]